MLRKQNRTRAPILDPLYGACPELVAVVIQAFPEGLQAGDVDTTAAAPNTLDGELGLPQLWIHHAISSPARLSISSLRARPSGISDDCQVDHPQFSPSNCPLRLLHVQG